jgi:hypothetical protein
LTAGRAMTASPDHLVAAMDLAARGKRARDEGERARAACRRGDISRDGDRGGRPVMAMPKRPPAPSVRRRVSPESVPLDGHNKAAKMGKWQNFVEGACHANKVRDQSG